MKAWFFGLFFLIYLEIPVFSSTEGIIFLIQNKWGGILGISLDKNRKPSQPAMVRPNVDSMQYPLIFDLDAFSNGGYQLTAGGKVLPIGDARLPYASWIPIKDASVLAMTPDEGGGWIAAGNTIKTIGNPPPLVFPTLDRKAVIADIEYNDQQQSLAILTRDGKIAICNQKKSEMLGSVSLKKDIAIDIELAPQGYWILTERGRVYRWDSNKMTPISSVPELGKGLACDLESALDGKGFYILDIFGVIHACEGAAPIPTEPLTKPAAVDLEIIPGDTLPTWNPPGLNTELGWNSTTLLLDPQGPSKSVSLLVHKAEHMTVFLAQIRFDPKLVSLDPASVRVGKWWNEGLRESRINPVVDSQKGVMTLQGSGDYFPFEGASGGGELAHIAVAPLPGITEAITVLQVEEFFYRDAYQGNIDHSCPIINSCTVQISPIQPQLDFVWEKEKQWLDSPKRNVKSGEIIQADIRVENGSRIHSFEFGFRFSTPILRYLGMTPGNVWRPNTQVLTHFEIPEKINTQGGINHQKLEAEAHGSSSDQQGAIVSLFFAVTSPGEGKIQITEYHSLDHGGNSLNLEMIPDRNIMSVVCE